MKAVKWSLIALAVIAVIVITLPTGIFSNCKHTYTSTDCTVKQCTKCGIIIPGEFHSYEAIPCTNKQQCSSCQKIHINPYKEYHHTTTIEQDCTVTSSCLDCGKQISCYTRHEWVTENCEEGFYCKHCGSTDSPSHLRGHIYTSISDFFDLPEYCPYCGDWYFPPLTIGAVCVYLGLLMSIAAFIFIFINRKRIRIREGRFIGAVTPDSQLKERGTEEEYF